jgi:flavin-dependent dehydrogenase
MASIPVSVTASGTIVHGRGLLSGDAAWYAFPSAGNGITPSDGDRSTDIFIRGPLPLP